MARVRYIRHDGTDHDYVSMGSETMEYAEKVAQAFEQFLKDWQLTCRVENGEVNLDWYSEYDDHDNMVHGLGTIKFGYADYEQNNTFYCET